jgi:excisionase family DNA binding protein
MARVSFGARNRSSPEIQRRGPARAGGPDNAAGSQEPVDVFDHLARCSNLLTTKELAALLAVSPKTVYSYVTRNIIPHYKIASSVRFRARDIAEWLRSHAA